MENLASNCAKSCETLEFPESARHIGPFFSRKSRLALTLLSRMFPAFCKGTVDVRDFPKSDRHPTGG